MKKTILLFGAAALLIPYMTTLAWNGPGAAGDGRGGGWAVSADVGGGSAGGGAESGGASSERVVLLDRGEGEPQPVSVEEYLIGLVAGQIPADYHLETIKAQAIIARTYIYKQMGESSSIMESSLDVDYTEPDQKQVERFRKIGEAVEATAGTAISYEGAWIDALYHRVSAGNTRDGGELLPYIRPSECPEDYESPDFSSEYTWTKEEFAAAVNRVTGAARGQTVTSQDLPQSIQIIEKDKAGYVISAQIGTVTFTGEELQFALGLVSPCFSFGEENGKITCVTKGSGHGFGFDQYGANRKAESGWTAEELLKFYYKNIVLISE